MAVTGTRFRSRVLPSSGESRVRERRSRRDLDRSQHAIAGAIRVSRKRRCLIGDTLRSRAKKLCTEVDESPEPDGKQLTVRVEKTDLDTCLRGRAVRQDVCEMSYGNVFADHCLRQGCDTCSCQRRRSQQRFVSIHGRHGQHAHTLPVFQQIDKVRALLSRRGIEQKEVVS